MIIMMKVIPHNYVTRYGYHYFATENIDFYKGSTTSHKDVDCKLMAIETEGSSYEDEEIV